MLTKFHCLGWLGTWGWCVERSQYRAIATSHRKALLALTTEEVSPYDLHTKERKEVAIALVKILEKTGSFVIDDASCIIS